ncbi:DUF3011 domain-containing protein [Dokdonella sp.]|uniref:DUF3011 domain-containing protein n=1 Tax=Dokdonella sp. TaxID=2291710 RepID=UPI003C47E60B
MLGKTVAAGLVLLGSMFLMPESHAQRGGQGNGGNEVRCTSQDYRFQRCGVNWSDAVLVQRTSSSSCSRGRSWGIDRSGLWVDRGCGGVFRRAGGGGGGGNGGHHGGGWNPGPNWDRDFSLTCQSQDYRYRMCQIDIGRGGGVRIQRQISNTACIQGRTWGYNRAGVWVSGGCAAVFRVDRRWN